MIIDTHCHLIPGVDDGPRDEGGSLALARMLVAQGVGCVIATPHVSHDWANAPGRIAEGVEQVRAIVRDADLPLQVLPGAELSAQAALDISATGLREYAFGRDWVLVEPPLSGGVAALQILTGTILAAGLVPLLAHPERDPEVQEDPRRLAPIASMGVALQVVTSSLLSRTRAVSRAAWTLLEAGMVNVVASDSHGAVRRPPDWTNAGAAVSKRLGPGLFASLTEQGPAVLLAGHVPPPARAGAEALARAGHDPDRKPRGRGFPWRR